MNGLNENLTGQSVRIKSENKEDERTLFVRKNESLMDALIREGYYINAVCAGRGICGKCTVRVLEGSSDITPEDRRFFSQEEIENGCRLSCRLYPKDDLVISLNENNEADFEVLSQHNALDISSGTQSNGYEIAIDIGTTTIAFELLNSCEIIYTLTSLNHQRKYGSDVISRINSASNGKSDELRVCIQNDLQDGILSLCKACNIGTEKIKRIAIACNTTMSHLLMGYDCKTLGQYPFTPVNIDFIRGSAKEIIGIECSGEVVILPGISTYVGGDIVSGLYDCGFYKSQEITLLVDLGTNGEMALGNRDKILVTSTAAGPAFEGGNISCGVGSVEGAICSVDIDGELAKIKTIRDKEPIGICGTGVIELTSELLKADIIDETGLLDEKYFEDGFFISKSVNRKNITFTQKDVREIQLAKAAIRAGIETLLVRYGISKNEVSRVYIAGGFGYGLDTEKAIAIGMLPKEFRGLTKAVGNTSLSGAVKYLCNKGTEKMFNKILEVSEEISLSMDEQFNSFYMDSMMF